MNAYIQKILEETQAKNSDEKEFLQAVEEFLTSLEPVIDKHPEYQQMALLERLGEEGLAPGEFIVTEEIGEPETVDSPEAAAAVAGFTLWRFLRRPSWPAALLAGVGLGLLQNTKFTALLFVPLFALVVVVALWLRRFKGGAARRVGGPLWQRSYWDRHARESDDAVAMMLYTLENPVRRGLCKEWTDWPWSWSEWHQAGG